MIEHAVVIAGGGPAEMALAAELALAKAGVAVVERRPTCLSAHGPAISLAHGRFNKEDV